MRAGDNRLAATQLSKLAIGIDVQVVSIVEK
jgi:hypothetical protein